jgi:recombination protein RecT
MSQNLPAQSEQRPLTLRDRLNQMTPEFKKALPGHIPAEKFVRTVQTAVQMNPQIAKACDTQGGMQSLMAACTKAATDGLILDNREAALVTFRQNVKANRNDPDKWEDRVQYIPMVAGLMKKARNSGEISSIAAHVVYANDTFHYVLGDEERIEHQPTFGDRGAAIAVYAIVKMKDGTVQREVMDKAAVMAIAKQSKNAGQYNPDTGANFGEWWRKTVIRRISKYLPSSSDRDEFLQAVERIDDGFDYEATNNGPTEPAPQPAKKRGAGAAALKDITPKQAAQPAQEGNGGTSTPHDPDTGEIIDGQTDDSAPQPGDDI